MSEANVEIVREVMELLQRPHESPGRVLERIDPYIVLINAPSAPETKPYVGFDGMREWLRTTAAGIRDFEIDSKEIVDAGSDHVIALSKIHGKGDRSGIPFEIELASIVTFLNGRILRVQAFESKAQALEAAGLAE